MALCRLTTYMPTTGRQKRWGWVHDGGVTLLDEQAVASVFTSPSDSGLLALASTSSPEFQLSDLEETPGHYGRPSLEAPVSASMEVWAAGVTYESSKFARMAESTDGGDFYAKVYVAERPELFFKATPRRVVGTHANVRIREDATWSVPEPELTVMAAANGQILGYTIGNDMSSRDIEGANPLYLPQAKVYRGSCAIGPKIVPAQNLDPHTLDVTLTIRRDGETAFEGHVNTGSMKRRVGELVEWLFRENDFPGGACLMTGTGTVPPGSFTLNHGDEIEIAISGIGVLRNRVE